MNTALAKRLVAFLLMVAYSVALALSGGAALHSHEEGDHEHQQDAFHADHRLCSHESGESRPSEQDDDRGGTAHHHHCKCFCHSTVAVVTPEVAVTPFSPPIDPFHFPADEALRDGPSSRIDRPPQLRS